MEADPVQYEVVGHVAHVWLNRPERRNAITYASLDALGEAMRRAADDDAVRVIVLRGREGMFCAGFDLDELQGDLGGAATAQEAGRRTRRICDRLHDGPKPSVAVLEGFTAAAGFELMLNCDFAIAADDARIGDFLIRRGLFGGAGQIYRLPRILGVRRAKELMLTGRMLTGVEAKEWGLVNDSAPASELDERVARFAATLADKSPLAMRVTKLAVNRGLDADSGSLMVIEELANTIVLASDDAAEGVSSFLEKREPRWSGR